MGLQGLLLRDLSPLPPELGEHTEPPKVASPEYSGKPQKAGIGAKPFAYSIPPTPPLIDVGYHPEGGLGTAHRL